MLFRNILAILGESDVWKALASLNISSAATVMVDNYIYKFGGGTTLDGNTNIINRYDITRNIWETLSGTTQQIKGGICYHYNGFIYLIPSSLTSMYRYEIATGTIIQLGTTSLVPIVLLYSGVGIGKYWYYTEGYNFYRYDCSTNTSAKTNLAQLPLISGQASRRGVMGVIGDKIYYIGGDWPNNGGMVRVCEYDIATNVWTTLSVTLPIGRCYAGYASFDNAIYIMGGFTNADASSNPTPTCYKFDGQTFTRLKDMPVSVGRNSCTALNYKIYSVGGYTGTAVSNYVGEYTI